MASFSTILIAIFMVIFWIFRAIVALCTQFSINFLEITSYNLNLEIIILFLTLLCIALFIKRKLFGSLLYLILYGGYFGEHFINNIIMLSKVQGQLGLSYTINLVMDLIAIVLALFALIDMLADKRRKEHPIDRKTDWYFNNKKYDEELNARDKREDNNEYKFY